MFLALQPWTPVAVPPQLGPPPSGDVGLGDATPLESGPAIAVAPARPANGGRTGAFVSTATAASGEPQPVAGLGPARALTERPPAQPVGSAPAAPAPEPVAAPEPEPAATPVAAPIADPAPQVVATLPKDPSALGGAPGPSAAGVVGPQVDESEPEEEAPVEEEADAEGEPGEEEGECTPPFSVSLEGAEHEVALCLEVVGEETRLYLLLDGALIEIDVP